MTEPTSKPRKRRPLKVIGIIVVCLVIVFFVGSFVLVRKTCNKVYTRYTPEGPSLLLTDDDIASDYPFTEVSFQLDGYTLRGCVYGKTPDARGLVIVRHGIFSSHQTYLSYIIALVDKGWEVFAFDAIGCGDSDGDSILGFPQSAIDVHAAVQYARESGMAGDLPILLFGHSWGGYGVAAALDYDDDVAGCVTMSGFDAPRDIILESGAKMFGALAATQRPIVDLVNWLDFGSDGARSSVDAINSSGVPVLVIHGTEDDVVKFDGASIIAKRERITNPEVRYLVLDTEGRNGHNSYFYSPESQAYFGESMAALRDLAVQYGGAKDDVDLKEELTASSGGAVVDYSVIPEDVLDDFMASVDKRRANTADPYLVDQIDAFFANCIE